VGDPPRRRARARTKVICLENTRNGAGGRALSTDYVSAVRAIADARALKVHVDGARIFNAAVALGVPVAHLARDADSLTFCLTKGLACPVGWIIVGDAAFIAEARRNRKILGGGMGQAGVFAAAGMVALNEMVDRLAEDHANARRLADGLADVPGAVVDPQHVETNIVYFELRVDHPTAAELVARLREHGLVIGAARGRRFRLVTHYGIEAADIDRALFAFEQALVGG
jgi:threonine aldolase